MKATSAVQEQVNFREQVRELARRLVDESRRRPELRRPGLVKVMEQAIAGLDKLVAALVHDPTKGSLSAGWDACPVCDSDPRRCTHGGQCLVEPDPKLRAEPWEAKTLFLPRTYMTTIKEAIARVREIAAPQWHSDSAALSLIALDFIATHSFTTASPAQTLRFLTETFEEAMRLRLVVFDRRGTLLYDGTAGHQAR